MSERPELTVSVPCPTCEYVLWVATPSGMQPTKQHAPKCPDCTDGTIRQALSCAGCKWFNHLEEGWGVCLRTEVDEETQKPIQPDSIAYVWGESIDGQCALMTHATHGCLAWEAKA